MPVPGRPATLMIDAGEPSEGVGDSLIGDSLNLALADAQNYVIQNTGFGQGNVTSSNYKPIQWTGIEQTSTDAVAPNESWPVTSSNDAPVSASSARQRGSVSCAIRT